MAKISTYPLDGNPKLNDKLIGTSVGTGPVGIKDPTYNFSLQQLLDLFSPLLPGNTLQGVLDNNNTATEDINLFGTISTTNLEVTDISNLFSAYISDSLYIEGVLFDKDNSQGTAGQILISTGDGVQWYTPTNVIPTLQEVLESGNEADVDIILTANLSSEEVNANAVSVQDSFTLNGSFVDSNGATGASGQMLISLGASGVLWQNVPVYTASSPLFINPATKNITIQQANGTQNGYLSYADWINFDGKQNALSGTGIVVSNGGTITYIVNNSSNWNQAYNDTIVSAAVSGTTTKVLTLTQRDGDTITASWPSSGGGTLSSVGLSMPVAFNVINTPLTSDGTIQVQAAGTDSQYIKGDGTLGTLPSVLGFVPYTGANQNVNLGSNNITASALIKSGGTASQFLKADGSIDSNSYITISALAPYLLSSVAASTYYPIPTGTTSQYVRGDGSLATFPSIASEAQRLVTEVYNKTGATLTKGTVVLINDGQGNLPTVTKAIATGDATSAQTYGVVQNDITDNNNGWVVVIGSLSNLDTQEYAPGTQLYLSPTIAGQWTSVKQYAPAHLVYVGIVVRQHPTQGVVEIKIQNGFEMDELHNVAAQNPNNNDILQYVSSTNLWTSKAGITDNIAEGTTNLYFTNSRARAALSASSPLSYNNATGVFSIAQAGASSNGFLSSTDWNTFNNKQNALTNPITGTGTINTIPKFTGTSTLGNSLISDDGTNVNINFPAYSSALNLDSPYGSILNLKTSGVIHTSLAPYAMSVDNFTTSWGIATIYNENYPSTTGLPVLTVDWAENGGGIGIGGWNLKGYGTQIANDSFFIGYGEQPDIPHRYFAFNQGINSEGIYSSVSDGVSCALIDTNAQYIKLYTSVFDQPSYPYNYDFWTSKIDMNSTRIRLSNEYLYNPSNSNPVIEIRNNQIFIGRPNLNVTNDTGMYYFLNGGGFWITKGTSVISNDGVTTLAVAGGIRTQQYRLSALNTAPASATASGATGEIRYTTDYIYVCVATNTWKRTALTTW